MDSVCRTCVRIIDVNEGIISINDTDLREKIQVCLPELVLDNVVDPKMCSTCSAALSLSFRFKGMCYEAERTINNCIQNKSSDGIVNPLDDIDLLTIGRRDVGDIVVGDANDFIIAEEVEVESSLDNTQNECYESLQILSDVASQASKAVEHIPQQQNKKSHIELEHITQKPANYIKPSIREAVANASLSFTRRKLTELESLRVPKNIKRHSNSTEGLDKTLLSAKVVVETTPVLDFVEKMKTPSKSSNNNPVKRKPVTSSKRSAKKIRRGASRKKFVHTTGEDDLEDLHTVTTVLEHTSTPLVKKEDNVKVNSPKKVSAVEKRLPNGLNIVEKVGGHGAVKTQVEPGKEIKVINDNVVNMLQKHNVLVKKLPSTPKIVVTSNTIISANDVSVDKKPSDSKKIQPKTLINSPTHLKSNNVNVSKITQGNKTPDKITKVSEHKNNKASVVKVVKVSPVAQSNPVATLVPKPSSKIPDTIVKDIKNTKTNKSELKDSKTSQKEIVITQPKEIKTKLPAMQTKNPSPDRSKKTDVENTRHISKTNTEKDKAVTTPVIKTNNTPKKSTKTPQEPDDVNDAIEKLLQTPEYQKLLQLETVVERSDLREQLKQLSSIVKQHKLTDTINGSKTKRKLETELDKETPVKKTNLKRKSPRAAKTLVEIELDLAEINDGVKRQKQSMITAENIESVPVLHDASPVENISVQQTVPDISEQKKKKRKLRVSYDVRRLKRRRKIKEAKKRGHVFYKRKEIDGRTLKRKPPQHCKICSKVFKYGSQLVVHQRSHEFIKSHKCDLCGKVFTLQRYLAQHTLLHFSAGDNQCDVCDKYFSSPYVLNKHKQTHTGEKTYLCNICNRGFSQMINLRVHSIVHTKEKKFICYVCNSGFGQKAHLIGHIRTHTGEKPYACDLCPKKYAKNSVLRTHKSLHNTKPFGCSSCHILFKDKHSLNRHLNRCAVRLQQFPDKSFGKIFNCGICSKCFINAYSRDRHMKVHVKDLIEGIATKF